MPRRSRRAWAQTAKGDDGRRTVELTLTGICSVSAELLSAEGASIALLAAYGRPVAVYSSNPSFDRLDDLQFTLGVGPTLDAFWRGAPVAEADLVADPPLHWPGFADQAMLAGVGAAFSFPLQVEAARLGALTVYRSGPGHLGPDRSADAGVMAGVITRSILDLGAGAGADVLASGLFQGRVDLLPVHQASGMVAAQLHIGVGEALACIRAHAFVTGTTIQHVGAQVVSEQLQISI